MIRAYDSYPTRPATGSGSDNTFLKVPRWTISGEFTYCKARYTRITNVQVPMDEYGLEGRKGRWKCVEVEKSMRS